MKTDTQNQDLNNMKNQITYPGNFYVYTHSIDGVVFYVGSSELRFIKGGAFRTHHERAFAKNLRDDTWHKHVNGRFVNVEIAQYHRTREEVTEAEYSLIHKLFMSGCPLTNKLGTKPVHQFSKTFTLLNSYRSIGDASDATNIDPTSISNTCSMKRRTAGGFIWSLTKVLDEKRYENCRVVLQTDLNGNPLAVFSTIQEARVKMGVRSGTSIKAVIHNRQSRAYGFKWRFIQASEAIKMAV